MSKNAADPCPVARSLGVVGDGWTLLIVRSLLFQGRRFVELQSRLGIAKNILSSRLAMLKKEGLVEQAPTSEGAATLYQLTAKGRDLLPVLVALRQWSERHLFDDSQPGDALVDRRTGQPLRQLELVAHDGRRVDLADIDLIAR